MNKFLTVVFSLLLIVGLVSADDLTLNFEDDSDISNWSNHDEADLWTVPSHDATGGVDGSGALRMTDAGWDMMLKRAITATPGTNYELNLDVKVAGFAADRPVYLIVQGIGATDDTLEITDNISFTTAKMSGKVVNSSGYIKIYGSNVGQPDTVWVDNVMFDDAMVDLFISEMIEAMPGTGNNKAWEIYNPMNTAANLDDYQIAQSVNGDGWEYWHTFPAGATLEPGGIWTIIADEVDTTLFDTSRADEALGWPSVVHHNGDDARGLVKIVGTDTTWLDIFGVPDEDPGSGWDVAGVGAATANHMLMRKRDVLMGNTDWTASAGTNADDSEWIVIAPNDHYNLADSLDTWNDFRYLGTQAINELMAGVNMSIKMVKGEFDPATDHVSIAGNFNGWNPGLKAARGTFSAVDSVVYFENVIRNKDAGDSLFYKFVINDDTWESIADNRVYVLTGDPGTAPTAYWDNISEYVPPVNLTFQVNMSVQVKEGNFDPATDVVRTAGSHQGWSPSAAADMDDSDGDSIYVETVQVDPNTTYYYKHIIGTDWGNNEDDPNREAVVGATDLVLPVVWFNRDSVVTEIASGNIEFFVDMSVVEELGLFDQAKDSLQIRGSFNGWSTSDPAKSLMNQNVLDPSEWFLNVPFVDAPKGESNYYKFFVQKDDTNHIWTDGYERPLTRGGGNREVPFNGEQNQSVAAVPYDDVSTEYVLTGGVNLQVTFSVDMRPAMDALVQAVPFEYGVDSLYFRSEQPLFAATQGWTDSDEMKYLLFSDDDGDSIFTATLTVLEPGFNGLEYRYAFVDVSEGTWIEEPGGYGAGAYRVRYAGQDAARSFPVNPWPMPEDVWTNAEQKNVIEVDPYDSYDKYLELDVEDIAGQIPEKFQLHQNYPNPFNPSTTFKFDLAQPGNATLKIFNVLGQEVVTVFDRSMKAGSHEYTWQATDANGYLLSSGIYFFQLVTEKNIAVKKMVMLK